MTRHAILGRHRLQAAALRAFALCALWLGTLVQAAPIAGSFIDNEASATYRDTAGNPLPTVVSNRVEARVEQVGAFTLTSSQTRLAAPGQTVYFPHLLTNTGNGDDSFPLAVSDSFAGGFNFAAIALYADANGDGLPDNSLPISNTGPLAAGAFFRFIASAVVPGAAGAGQQDQLTVRALGTAGVVVAAAQNNTDTVSVSNSAVLVANKSISVLSGPSPFDNGGAHLQFTITLTNTGSATASQVRVSDVVGGVSAAPAYNTIGMLYVPGSARLNGAPLTDVPGGDGAGVDFSANINGNTAQLSALLLSVPPNTTHRLSFLVDIGAGLPPGTALSNNIARIDYFDGAANQLAITNTAAYEVQPAAATPNLTIVKSATTPTFTVGFNGSYNLAVRNSGNAPTSGSITVTDALPVGMSFVALGSGGTGWVCAPSGQTVVCTSNQVISAQNLATSLRLVVAVAPQAAAAPQPVANTATVSGGGEPVGADGDNSSTASVAIGAPAAIAGRVWLDGNHNRRFDTGETLLDGWVVEVLRVVGGRPVVIAATRTGPPGGHAAAGTYRIDGLEAGAGYIVRFLDPGSSVLFANPVDGESGQPVSNASINGGWLRDITLGAGQTTIEQSLPLDPMGVVYDSQTRLSVSGATVTLQGPSGFDPAQHLIGGNGNVSQVTGSSGFYQFLLRPGAPAGVYRFVVVSPLGYLPFSAAGLLPASPNRGACPASATHCLDPTGLDASTGVLPVQPQVGPPPQGQPFTHYLAFNLDAGDPNVVNNHIPLDPVPPSAIFVQKTASRGTVELGDFVDYTVQVRNTATVPIPGLVTLRDALPAGFAYQPGSARLNNQALADPVGGAGPSLRWDNLPALGPSSSHRISYRVRVGVGALQGDGINRAQASAGALASMSAQAKVIVQGGVFSDKAYIVGKVVVDCNRDRLQNAEEIGIPGVRVYLEDGTFAVSDSEGKYSFYGVSPRTHVLKLDMTSMPVGSELIVLGNRNAGDPGSRFVDLKKGELHRANFAEGSCDAGVMKQVFARRDKGAVFVAETDRQLEAKVSAGLRPPTVGDVKALPASGLVGGDAQVPSFTPVLPAPSNFSGISGEGGASAAPVRAAPSVNLDALLPSLDNSLGFIDLKDGDTLPAAQTPVRVKGPIGSSLRLSVNGVEQSAQRVGTKATLSERQSEAWEYIGVDLKPGTNTLELLQRDPFGNLRGSKTIKVVAPDKLGRLLLVLPEGLQAADGHTPARIRIELSDAAGVPVTARTPLTLEASLGRWDVKDLNPREPGVQVFIEGGRAEFTLLPPQEPGDALVRVTSGLLKAEQTLAFLPDLRPLIGAGVIEGVLNLRNLNGRNLVPARANDGFEEELKHFSRASGNGKNDAAARAAFFLKGKVKGEYLLTMAYDSDKDTKERLFRDIQPDQFYPVYGDSAVKGFDAQSTSRLYVRIDQRKSYLLYGDFNTAASGGARQLGAYNRSLTGVKEHYENKHAAVNVYASRDSTRQLIEELPARGVSGPYVLSGRDMIANSERVEILTRDRDQPGVVLKTVTLARFSDYDFEPQSGRLLFKAPVPTLDAGFNPNSIRVTYEVDQGGARFWVYGADGQLKLSERVEVGGSWAKDNNPQDTTEIKSANATVKLADKTFLIGEVASIQRQLGGAASVKGNAARVEFRHDGEQLQVQAQAGRSDAGFNNPASPLNNGREEASAKAAYKLDERNTIKAEAIRSVDSVNQARREGALLLAEHQFDNGIKVEAGARHSVETSATAKSTVDSVRLKVAAPVGKDARVFGELEQDVHDSDKRVVALGGDVQLASRTKLYARHELISSLGSSFSLTDSARRNATVLGIDSDVMTDGHLFNEYRVRDAINGREAEAAIGLRNKWALAEGVALNTNLERIKGIGGASANESLVLGASVDYTASPLWKGSARVEFRNASASEQWLLSLGLANKLSRDWTFLGRELVSLNRNKGSASGELLVNRLQFGLAYRDTDSDRFNGLARIEHKVEDDSTNPLLALSSRALTLSAHVNYQATKPLILSGRIGARWASDQSNGLSSRSRMQSAGVRATYDINSKWDSSLHASLLHGADDGTQTGLGAELGYLLANNLWLSGGYNVFGYRASELVGADHTSRGAYLRLRFKFDENLFGASNPSVNPARTPRVAP